MTTHTPPPYKPPRKQRIIAGLVLIVLLFYIGAMVSSLLSGSVIPGLIVAAILALSLRIRITRSERTSAPLRRTTSRAQSQTISGTLRPGKKYIRPQPGKDTALTLLRRDGTVMGSLTRIIPPAAADSDSDLPVFAIENTDDEALMVLGYCHGSLRVDRGINTSNVTVAGELTVVA